MGVILWVKGNMIFFTIELPPNAKNDKRHYLQLSGYPQHFIDPVINTKGSSCPKKENLLGSVYIPHVKGVSEKLKHIGKCKI